MSTSRRIVANTGYLGALTASNYLLGLLIFPHLSRVLSLGAFGLVGFSMSFVVIFQVIVEYGFMITATAQIVEAKENVRQVGRIVSTTIAAKIVLASLAVLVFVLAAILAPMVREHVPVVGLFALSAVVAAFIPDFYFRGVEKMRSIALRALSSKLLALAVVLLFVRGDEALLLVPVALLAGNSLAASLGFAGILRAGVPLQRPGVRETLRVIRDGVGFFASRAAASVNQAVGSVVLGTEFAPTSTQMAHFTGAWRIASAGELAVIPISDAIYPHMVRTRDYRIFWKVYSRGLVVWCLGCLLVFIFAERLCVWFLGPSFASAAVILRILTIGAFIAYSSNLFGYAALTPLGLAGQANIALVVGAVVTTVGALVLLVTGVVTPISVSALLVASQFSIFTYRFATFTTHRR